MLTSKGDLCAAELAFFCPALIISIFILFRHGFNKQLGWMYLAVLSLLRIIGASAILYSETQNDTSAGLLETAAITSAVGTAPLLLATMGFLQRINQGMSPKGVPLLVFRPIHLASLAGLVLAIIGGTDMDSTNASTIQTGRHLLEAASIVFLFMYIALAAIALLNVRNSRFVLPEETWLMRAIIIALPFLLVRIAYTVAVGFSNPGSLFWFDDVNVFVSAFMQFLMEAIVVCIYISAGLVTPRAQKPLAGSNRRDVEEGGYRAPAEQDHHVPKYEQQGQRPRYQAPQQERSLGDYRPSKLIMDAIRSRQ